MRGGSETVTTWIHAAWCPTKMFGHTDAAKRLSDTYNLHRIGRGLDAVGKWFAASLAEGRSDDVLYDSKLAAVRGQHHNETYYVFIKIAPCDMKVCEAEVMLRTHRQLYDKGMRIVDPDHKHGGPDLIKRITAEDQLNAMGGRVTGLIMPWEAMQ